MTPAPVASPSPASPATPDERPDARADERPGGREDAGAPEPQRQTPELTDLVHSVSHGLRRTWMADLSPFGISPHQWRALHTIVAHDGEAQRQRDVASALRIAPRSAAEVISQLEAEGWITRSPDPSDKRAVLLTATESGRELEGRIRGIRSQRGSEYFATLDSGDRAELARLLGLLLEAHPRPEGAGPSGRGPRR